MKFFQDDSILTHWYHSCVNRDLHHLEELPKHYRIAFGKFISVER